MVEIYRKNLFFPSTLRLSEYFICQVIIENTFFQVVTNRGKKDFRYTNSIKSQRNVHSMLKSEESSQLQIIHTKFLKALDILRPYELVKRNVLYHYVLIQF